MLRENVPLHKYANYKIGGPARYFWRARTIAEIKEGLVLAKKLKAKIFILGGGTNLLIPDAGYDGFVLKPEVMTLRRKGNAMIAGAGVPIADLLKFTIKQKLSGLEWAGGLPGTLGGAIRGNAGAFGGEIKDTIVSVKSLNVRTGKVITRSQKECRFRYRSSIFKEKKGREVVVAAVFHLVPGDPRAIRKAIGEKIRHRLARHPMEYPNIGSIFKNVAVKDIPKSRHKELVYDVKTDPIPVIPTARLLTKAGLKGVQIGGAMFSEKHPNFIVNVENATAKDVITLMELAKKTIKKMFSITLTEEVERL